MCKKTVSKTCCQCGKLIHVQKHRQNSQRFCDKICYTKWQLTKKNPQNTRKTIICETCRKIVDNVPNYLNKRFCGRKCANVFIAKTNIKEEKFTRKKECVYCKDEYIVWNYRKESKFCSKRCYDQYRNEEILCPTCKKTFRFPKYEKRKYCSEKCAAQGMDKRRSKFSISVRDFLKKTYKEHIEEEKCVRVNGNKYFLDFIIKGNINIECDGTYWHCDSHIYDPQYYHTKIKKTAQEIWDADQTRDENLNQIGYVIIRLKEWKWMYEQKKLFETLKGAIDEISKDKINS